jgi:hypothetical protein
MLAGGHCRAYVSHMRMHWTQTGWRHWHGRAGVFTWRERLALILLALLALPVLLLVLAGLFLFAVGLATVGLAGWAIAGLLRPRRPHHPGPSVISTRYERLSEERDRDQDWPDRGQS